MTSPMFTASQLTTLIHHFQTTYASDYVLITNWDKLGRHVLGQVLSQTDQEDLSPYELRLRFRLAMVKTLVQIGRVQSHLTED